MDRKEIAISSLKEPLFVDTLVKFLEKSGVKQITYITYGPSGEERAFKKAQEVRELLKKRHAYEDIEIAEMKNEWRFHFSHDGSFGVQGNTKFISELLNSLKEHVKTRFDVYGAGEKKPKLGLLELRNEEEELYFRIGRGMVLMDLIRKLAEYLGMDMSKLRLAGFYNLPYDAESYDRISSPQGTMQVTMTKEAAHIVVANPGGHTNWTLRKKLIEIVYEFCEKASFQERSFSKKGG